MLGDLTIDLVVLLPHLNNIKEKKRGKGAELVKGSLLVCILRLEQVPSSAIPRSSGIACRVEALRFNSPFSEPHLFQGRVNISPLATKECSTKRAVHRQTDPRTLLESNTKVKKKKKWQIVKYLEKANLEKFRYP